MPGSPFLHCPIHNDTCQVCENFVSVRDLVHCGLFQSMFDAQGEQVSSSRDRVSLSSDGTWKLRGENKLRYKHKNSDGGGNRSGAKSEVNDGIIDLV